MYVCMCIIHVCVCVFMYTHKYVFVYHSCVCVCIFACTCTNVLVYHSCMRVCVFTCMCKCVLPSLFRSRLPMERATCAVGVPQRKFFRQEKVLRFLSLLSPSKPGLKVGDMVPLCLGFSFASVFCVSKVIF